MISLNTLATSGNDSRQAVSSCHLANRCMFRLNTLELRQVPVQTTVLVAIKEIGLLLWRQVYLRMFPQGSVQPGRAAPLASKYKKRQGVFV